MSGGAVSAAARAWPAVALPEQFPRPLALIGAGMPRCCMQPAEPDAKETADLVAQKRDAVEHRHILGAENLRHQPAGERHGAEPEKPHKGREDHCAHVADR